MNELLNRINSKTKRRLLRGIGIGTVLGGCLLAYQASGKNEVKEEKKEVTRMIHFDGNALEDDIRSKVNSEMEVQHEMIDDQNARLTELEGGVNNIAKKMADLTVAINAMSETNYALPIPEYEEEYEEEFQEPPIQPMPQQWDNTLQEIPEPELKGGIVHYQPESVPGEKSVKKNGKTIHLPPSFMKAKLLTGIEAEVSNFGDKNPEQVLLRVQAPAVLPNEIRANLRGCFVVGNVYGRLNKERVDVKVVSMHCLSHDDRAVVEANEMIGFVVDQDGKKGMAGIVVSKAGVHMARLAASGVLEGFSDAVTADSTTTSVSALGVTQTLDKDKMANAGLAQGAKKGLQGLSDIYLALAKQTTPVIEVGTAKEVTVVLAKTAELKISAFRTLN